MSDPFEDLHKKGWKTVPCAHCGGHGQVSDYGDGRDFYGAKECRKCDGSGSNWVTPSGKHVIYPGGPFV